LRTAQSGFDLISHGEVRSVTPEDAR
jgi:hypothetical protein